MRNLLAFMVMLPCIISAQLPDFVPTDGLAVWYDFREGLNDLSSNQLNLTLNAGAQYTGSSIKTDGISSWAETENLTGDFQGDPEFTVILLVRRTEDFLQGASWGLGGGLDGQVKANMNSWNRDNLNAIQIDLWGTQTWTTEQTYSPDNFQVIVWRKSGPGFSNQTMSININGPLASSLFPVRGSGTDYPILPDTSRFFLGKAGVADNYYAPMEFRVAGLYDRAISIEEIDVLISNLLIEGCTDSNACNFNENALSDDGSCVSCEVLAQACGEGTVWDSATSTCVPAVLSGDIAEDCTIMNLQELAQNHLLLVNQLATADSLLAICNGTADGDSPWTCGDPLSYESYDYATALIGDQCWFAENLRSENYFNGDAIPSGLSGGDWSATLNGAVAVYGEGNTSCYDATSLFDVCDEAVSLELYGRLYNWYTVNDSRGLCPAGWHVPTDGEWTVLGNAVSAASANPVGIALKAQSGWWNNGNGTDEFGFAALPGGVRNDDISPGAFVHTGTGGAFWSATSSGSGAWYRGFDWSTGTFYRTAYPSNSGYSVRCLKD